VPAVTKITVQKAWQQRYWVNVYHLNVGLNDALDPLNAIVAAERAVHNEAVLITTARAATVAPGDELYFTVPINQFGQKNSGNSQLLATFIAARVDFAAGAGRPSRKFLRGCLQEEDVAGWALNGPQANLFQTYGNAIVAIPEICDVDGEALTSAVMFPTITGRQHRRGSKKKSTPSSPTPV
jgi:hypothetical protein